MAARRKLSGVHSGRDEAVLDRLPQRVLRDLDRRHSESALLWNRIYARATPRVSMAELLALPQLWGPAIDPIEDSLEPYYWGFNLAGRRLAQLDTARLEVDGAGPTTEVDLFLVGESELVLIEAKAEAGLGRCGRYAAGRCPEIHGEQDGPHSAVDSHSSRPAQTSVAEIRPADPSGRPARAPPDSSRSRGSGGCRYWEVEQASFARWLDFGPRPSPGSDAPPCDRHYQLGRTLLLGQRLAERLGRRPHLWLLLPQRRWRRLEPVWLDFVDRVRSPQSWRRMRVISWEALSSLPVPPVAGRGRRTRT